MGLKIKAVDDAGHFTGVGAVYGNVDLGGDKILPGAFTKTLEGSKRYPLLWQHKSDLPVGSVTVSDTPNGLSVEGQLLIKGSPLLALDSDEVPQARIAYSLLKAGVIKGLSIGYDTEKAAYVDGVRELRELKLWELSIVTFPMNPGATILGVKNMSDEDRAKRVKSIDAHRKGIDRHQRGMREDLKALFDGFGFDDDDDDADDPDLGEGDLSEQDSKELLIEMQKMLALVRA
jgi:HK97 family phage prohead protease